MNKLVLTLLFVLSISCSDKTDTTAYDYPNERSIIKPKGVFSSSFGNVAALNNTAVNGSLIRVSWKDIEPQQGVFNFSKIDEMLLSIKSKKLKWSLGIIAGGDSPDWLINQVKCDYFNITGFDNTTKSIPKIWDDKANEYLNLLAKALANVYNDDEDLVLVYVPQMTVNGIEGHFNGVTDLELTNAGFDAGTWVKAVVKTAKNYANAFSNKALAFEVHDIKNNTEIPSSIMNTLWNDSTLNKRVGAAIWWISGKTTYQPELIEVLNDFPGDIYAQAIGRSDQVSRFKDDDYNTMFSQAKSMGVRYIELWEYEFVNNTYPDAFNDFNTYSNITID